MPPGSDQRDEEVEDREDRGSAPTADEVDAAREEVTDLLAVMRMEATADVLAGEDAILVSINGPDAGRLIGRQGQTLDALQYVLNRLSSGGGPPVYVDVEGYRERRQATLEAMALRLAQKAIAERRPVTVEPMSARDRRTMHLALSKVKGVTTRSRGEGAERQLQIIPVPAKP